MRQVTIDFETAWDSKDYTLSKMGPLRYIRDPRFHALMMGVRDEATGETHVIPHEHIPAALKLLDLENPDTLVVGHNLFGFDALILSEIYGVKPKNMADTQVLMRWTGLSATVRETHAALTAHYDTGVKKQGTVVSDGKYRKADFTSEEWDFFCRYCRDDVEQCAANFLMLERECDIPADCWAFCSLIARMATEPAFVVDGGKVQEYMTALDTELEKALLELQAMFAFKDTDSMLKAIRSPKKFCEMLRELGCEPPMKLSPAAAAKGEELYIPALSKNDLEFKALLEYDDIRIQSLVNTRLEHNSSIHRTRAERLMQFAGQTLPVMFNVFKAHTSRLSAGNSEGASDGLNLQNLSKRNPAQRKLREAIRALEGHVVVAVDSSQIEARLLAWLAEHEDMLAAFRAGRDVYAEFAAVLAEVPVEQILDGVKQGDEQMKMFRTVAKTAILGAGYGISADKFSDALLRMGVRMDKDFIRHKELAHEAHRRYRETNWPIPMFWKRCEYVLSQIVMHNSGEFGGPGCEAVKYGHDGKCGYVEFPTGYRLMYPNIRAEEGPYGRVEYWYDKLIGSKFVPTRIYGAALTENITQGLAFQLLMWQAVRIHENGVRLASNVHDCWVAVVPEHVGERALEVMKECMRATPAWLPNFPVACEGKIGKDYTVA